MKRISKDFPLAMSSNWWLPLFSLASSVWGSLVHLETSPGLYNFPKLEPWLQICKSRCNFSDIFNKVVLPPPLFTILILGQNFPTTMDIIPQTITEGGIVFTRYTYVQITQEDSGSLATLIQEWKRFWFLWRGNKATPRKKFSCVIFLATSNDDLLHFFG